MSASRTDEPDARAPSQGPVGTGRCGVCGHEGEYVVTGAPTRESHECAGCRASLRYRLQAAAIAATYGHPEASLAELVTARPFSSFALYEPGTIGPFRRVLRDLRGYVNSYFWPDVPLGEERDGVRCEDLRALTFGDAAFDLVISSDILEHVRGPMEAFAEIHRVLRPGGVHVFRCHSIGRFRRSLRPAWTTRAQRIGSSRPRCTTAHRTTQTEASCTRISEWTFPSWCARSAFEPSPTTTTCTR